MYKRSGYTTLEYMSTEVINNNIDRLTFTTTGCDSGFGLMLARRLDEEGYKVFAGCLNINGTGPKLLLKEATPRLELLQLDVTKEADIEKAKASLVDSLAGSGYSK